MAQPDEPLLGALGTNPYGSRRGESIRWAKRLVVPIWVWPSSSPIISSEAPPETSGDANVWRRSGMDALKDLAPLWFWGGHIHQPQDFGAAETVRDGLLHWGVLSTGKDLA